MKITRELIVMKNAIINHFYTVMERDGDCVIMELNDEGYTMSRVISEMGRPNELSHFGLQFIIDTYFDLDYLYKNFMEEAEA